MASEKIGTVPPQQVRNALSSHPQPQIVFPAAFACAPQLPHLRASAVGDPKTSTRELTSSFLDHQPHYFHTPSLQDAGFRRQWNANCRDSGGNTSVDDDEEDDYNGDEEEEENNAENVVSVAKISDGNQEERFSANCSSQKNKGISAVGELRITF